MGLNAGSVRVLLLIACMLGVVQGLLTLIGGIITCFDRNKDVKLKQNYQLDDIEQYGGKYRGVVVALSAGFDGTEVILKGDAMFRYRLEGKNY